MNISEIEYDADKLSQFFKRKEFTHMKRKQTSIETFSVKHFRRPSFDDEQEVICLNPRKREEKTASW